MASITPDFYNIGNPDIKEFAGGFLNFRLKCGIIIFHKY